MIRPAAACLVPLLLLAAPAAACGTAMPPAAMTTPLTLAVADSPRFSAAVIHAVNVERCRLGLAPVTLDAAATRSSRGQSLAMAAAGRMTHDTSVPGRGSVAARFRAEGIHIRRKGYESIGMLGFYSVQGLGCHQGRSIPTEADLARRIVAMWLDSPPHRSQLLSPQVTQAGAAAAVSQRAERCGSVYLTITLYG